MDDNNQQQRTSGHQQLDETTQSLGSLETILFCFIAGFEITLVPGLLWLMVSEILAR